MPPIPITEKLLTEILSYLARHPYQEVAQLIASIQAEARAAQQAKPVEEPK
jgi:hypothetical protein